uniref:E2 ubiquitin-conjugating enzyme n=1 Tax=Dermatophagoides pteronyssinus TaxID=6956 RepID=A0A6P6Y071_DERPT|nr:ubiquitin-conjugating enzyme E2 S-like [Dermatophagoides pteronyssinus]
MSSSNVENLAPNVLRKISKELAELIKTPPEGIKLIPNEEDVSDIQAIVEGPAGTPYQNGSFRVKLLLGKSFPAQPPKGYFQTKIFHPNVSRNGEICVNTLKKDWNENLGIKHLLLVIKCLLIVPNPESALNEDAAKLLLENYDEYYRRAKMITEIHAKRSIQQQQCFDNRNCNENNDDDDKNVRNDYESTTSGDSSTQSSTANKTKSSSSNNDLMPLTKRPANNLNIINTTNITIDQQQMKNRNLQQSKSSSSVTQNKHKRTLKRL